jgi:hypothetical protein
MSSRISLVQRDGAWPVAGLTSESTMADCPTDVPLDGAHHQRCERRDVHPQQVVPDAVEHRLCGLTR